MTTQHTPTIVELFGIGTWPNARMSCGHTLWSVPFTWKVGERRTCDSCSADRGEADALRRLGDS